MSLDFSGSTDRDKEIEDDVVRDCCESAPKPDRPRSCDDSLLRLTIILLSFKAFPPMLFNGTALFPPDDDDDDKASIPELDGEMLGIGFESKG